MIITEKKQITYPIFGMLLCVQIIVNKYMNKKFIFYIIRAHIMRKSYIKRRHGHVGEMSHLDSSFLLKTKRY